MFHIFRQFFVTMVIVSGIVVQAQQDLLPVTPLADGTICWNKTEVQAMADELTPEGFDEFIASVGKAGGFYSAVFPASDNVEIVGERVFRAPANEEVVMTYSTYSPEEAQRVRFLAFHNEQQIMLGEETPYVDVVLSDESKFDLSIQLPPLEQGVHDIVVVYDDAVDEPPHPVGSFNALAYRFTIVAGDLLDEHPITYTPYSAEAAIAEDGLIRFTLTLTDDTLDAWNAPARAHRISTGETLDFNILTGYFGMDVINSVEEQAQPEVARFALIGLVDYEQVPLRDDSTVLYGQVEQGTAYARIPVTMPAFEEPGRYDIAIMQVNNPRIPICVLRGPDYSYSQNINFIRVALDVVGD